MADRYGVDFRRVLCSAERLSERAISSGFCLENTLRSRSSALLLRVTLPDHRAALPSRLGLRDLSIFRFFAIASPLLVRLCARGHVRVAADLAPCHAVAPLKINAANDRRF